MAAQHLAVTTIALHLFGFTLGQHDYGQALGIAQKFFLANRCGQLPDDKVPWRRDAFLDDGADLGIDLVGGYFDAGDHMKFGFPMASSLTMMAWGMVQYPDAFKSVGEWENALENLKWGTDYFIKAHISDNELVVNVGNETEDHFWWGRPQDFELTPRLVFKVDPSNPGSDVAGETAAALAAASIVFRESDEEYADTLLEHARTLFRFARNYLGVYSDVWPEGTTAYESWSFEDELAWSAMWLFKATKEAEYLVEAITFWDQFELQYDGMFLDWSGKTGGAAMLLFEETNEFDYRDLIRDHVNYLMNEIQKTPGGLIYLYPWGTCRHAANAAFQLLIADDLGFGLDGAVVEFARSQIDYILGDNPLEMSYLMGYGSKYPLRPHHRSSSCPLPEDCGGCECSWEAFDSADPNPYLLEGALVGGPDENDNWEDDRTDYVQNEVATDYNAGFQSALAGLIAKAIRQK